MHNPFQFLQDLTKQVTGTAVEDKPVIDIWAYAEPAGEEPDPLKRNVLQWRRVISSVRNPLEIFPGQPVDLIGFVHRTPTDAPDQFTLARRIIRCCLADTVTLGLSVYTPQGDQFATDSWLRVRGKFGVHPIPGKPTLAIVPTKIKSIPKPKKLYINGVF